MDGWHHRCNGHRIGPTSGDSDGQGGLVCYSPWSCQESDTAGQLNSNSKEGAETKVSTYVEIIHT